ncbi:MAG: haloacid dehalogenase type II [Desulfosalsimonadaceae bacterium]
MNDSMRPRALFFDVNETLLDLAEVKVSVGNALENRPELAALWFPMLLHHSLVSTVAGQFKPFGEIGVAALMMVAESNGIDLSEEKAKQAIQPILSAPPHPEVVPALRRLRKQNIEMGVLTNSSRGAMEQQMNAARMDSLFDFMLSVEDLGTYKPHQKVYQWAAAQRGMQPAECMMIAAHGWDVGGAAWAGMRAAFVERPGQSLYPLAPVPEIIAADMEDVADRLILLGK